MNSYICIEEDNIASTQKLLTTCGGNLGNSCPSYALLKVLFGKPVKVPHIVSVYQYDFSKGEKDIEFINRDCTHFILFIQDFIVPVDDIRNMWLPYKKIMEFISKIKIPILLIGIGLNYINADFMNTVGRYYNDFYKKLGQPLVDFLKFMGDHAISIGVRGKSTAHCLDKLGISKNVEIIGCPSYYDNPSRIIMKKPFSLNLRIIHTSNHYLGLHKKHNERVVLQDEREIIDTVLFGKNVNQLCAHYFSSFVKKQFVCFSNMEAWEQFLSQNDFAMGTRVHGAIMALRAGVPSVVFNRDLRAQEMTEYLHIPHYPIPAAGDLEKEPPLEEIYETCDYEKMNSNYSMLYDKYLRFLERNGLVPITPDKNEAKCLEEIKQPTLSLYAHYDFNTVVCDAAVGFSEQLAEQSTQLSEILNSRTWRYANKITSVFRKVFPKNSKRELIIKIPWKCMRKIISTLKRSG